MTTEISEDLELFHYGIKGMKWGVRRKDGPDGTVSSNPRVAKRQAKKEAKAAARGGDEKWKRPVSSDAREASNSRTRVKRHGSDALDNKELKKLVNRMNLEQQYSNLVENKKASSRRRGGQRYLAEILKESGKEVAIEGFKWGATQAVKYAFNQAAGRSSRSDTKTAYRVPTNLIEQSRKAIGR